MTVLVFGSNRQGRHGKGVALHAREHWGAVYGQAEGIQGHAYGIVTKELRRTHPPVTLAEVAAGVARFLAYAAAHPDDQFVVTRIGCGLAGFTDAQIAPLFDGAPPHVTLPREWCDIVPRHD